MIVEVQKIFISYRALVKFTSNPAVITQVLCIFANLLLWKITSKL